MNILRQLILGIAAAVVLAVGAMVQPSLAYTCDSTSARVKSGGSAEVSSPAECAQPQETRTVGGAVSDIINVVLAVLGVVAVLVIIIGGIQYVTSTGDMRRVTQAKDIIMYGIIGLIISLLAWAIVNFVIKNM